MDCALWLNKHKIYSADEIPEYPDIAALRGYYLGGCLERWLRDHNGEEYANKLAKLNRDDKELNKSLAEIFGCKPQAPLIEMRGELSETELPHKLPFSGYYGSVSRGSFGSYRLGSFRFGSFHQWEWEWLFRRGYSGSYRLGSFRSGSFHEWEWEWYFKRGSFGSYRLGSFRSGSFHEWEWEWLFGRGSFGSYRLSSFRFGSLPGSYNGFPLDIMDCLWESLDEYDRIMFLNLANCPLNRYGYGIHNI